MGRKSEFDVAKAIGLIAVIIIHSSSSDIPRSIVDFSFSFAMPLFFLISGYFFKSPSLTRTYIISSARRLLLPYAFTCVFVIIFAVALNCLGPQPDPFNTAWHWLIASLYGAGGIHPGMPSGVAGIGAIWYLWALFWGKLLLSEINRMPNPFIIACSLFVVGISTNGIIWLPFSIQNSLCAVLFMYIGQYCREHDVLHATPPLLWVCSLCTWLYCGAFYGQLYMQSNVFENGLIDIIGGVCGSLCVIKFGELLVRFFNAISRPIALLGRHTLPLFCMHLVVLNSAPWAQLLERCYDASVLAWPIVVGINFFGAILLSLFIRYMAPRAIRSAYY